MDAETRAALEWAIKQAREAADNSGESYLACRRHDLLQALLDEKGGGGPAQYGIETGSRTGLPVAGAASTAPPDSPARIAAEMREYKNLGYVPVLAAMRWAARVEALGLEPGERETVRQVREQLVDFHRAFDERGYIIIDRAIAALAPIAEKGAGT